MEAFLHAGMHWKILNFVLFVGLLRHFLRQPVADFWTKRSADLKEALSSSHTLRQEAQTKCETLEKRMSLIEREVSDLLRQLSEESEREKALLEAQAQKTAARMLEEAHRINDQEIRRAKESLKAQTAHLAIELAERLIHENFQSTDQERLSKKYLQELENIREVA